MMLAGTIHPVPLALPELSEDHALLEQSPFTFSDAAQSIRSGALEDTIQRLYAELTDEERLSLLDGDVPLWKGLRGILYDRYNREPFVHGHIPRLGIPGIRFTDGPRGIVMGASTAFPVSMSRGATWDVDFEERIGVAIDWGGIAQGANYYAGICINLPRHPAWDRIQETYGEDPILLGACGTALAKGVKQNLMTCVKHFALNSMENARFRVDVKVDDAAFHEVYLAHFRKVIQDAEVVSVMSSYNSVRGEWAGQSKELLIDVLRNQWGFDGFVLSDFIFGLRDCGLVGQERARYRSSFQSATSTEPAQCNPRWEAGLVRCRESMRLHSRKAVTVCGQRSQPGARARGVYHCVLRRPSQACTGVGR